MLQFLQKRLLELSAIYINGAALTEMEKVKISLPEKKQRKRKSISKSSKEKEGPAAQLEEGVRDGN